MVEKKGIDLSEFEAVAPRIGVQCWGSKLTEDQRAKVEAARADGFSYKTIAAVVTKWGVSTSPSAVPNHLNHDCKCYRNA